MKTREIKKKFDYSFSSSSSYGKEKHDEDSSFEIDEQFAKSNASKAVDYE